MKVKMFESLEMDMLQDEINGFLESLPVNHKIVDIKFSQCYDLGDIELGIEAMVSYGVLIIYQL